MQTIKTCNLSDEYKHVCFKDLENYIAIDKFVDVLNGYSDLELAKIRLALQVPNNIKVDDALNPFSTNPVENDVIYDALTRKADINKLARVAMTGNYNDLNNTPCKLPNPDALVIKGYGQPIIYDGNETVVLEIPTSVKDLRDWELVHIDYDKIKSLVPIKNIAVNNVIVPPNECGVVNLQVLTLKELNDALADLDFPDIDLEVVRNMINQAVGPTVISYIVEHMDDFKGNDGATGQRGPKGDSGKSAYQSYLDTTTDDPVLSESEWIESLHGADGTVSFDDLTDEQKEQLKGDPGPQGPTGPMGPMGPSGTKGNNGADGRNGVDGKSAYELAVGTGYPGSLEDWLDSLKGLNGEKGDKGDKGDTGPRGEVGPQGPQGPQGLPGVDGSKFNPEDYERWDQVLNLGRFALTSDLNSMRADLDTYTLVCKGCDEGDEECTQCEDAECTLKYGGKWGYKCSYVSDALLTLESRLGRAEATLEANTIVCDVCKEGYDCTDEDWTTNPEHFECRGVNSAFADFYTDTKQAIAEIKAQTGITYCIDKVDEDGHPIIDDEGHVEQECFDNFNDAYLRLKSDAENAAAEIAASYRVCRTVEEDGVEREECFDRNAWLKLESDINQAKAQIGTLFTEDDNFKWDTLGIEGVHSAEDLLDKIAGGGLTPEQWEKINNFLGAYGENSLVTTGNLITLISNELESGTTLRSKYQLLTKELITSDEEIVLTLNTFIDNNATISTLASKDLVEVDMLASYAEKDYVDGEIRTVTNAQSGFNSRITATEADLNINDPESKIGKLITAQSTMSSSIDDIEASIETMVTKNRDGVIESGVVIKADLIDALTGKLILGQKNQIYGNLILSSEEIELDDPDSSKINYLGNIALGSELSRSRIGMLIGKIDNGLDRTIEEFDNDSHSPTVVYPELVFDHYDFFPQGLAGYGTSVSNGIKINPVEGIVTYNTPIVIGDSFGGDQFNLKFIYDEEGLPNLSIGDSLLINSEGVLKVLGEVALGEHTITNKTASSASLGTVDVLVIDDVLAITTEGQLGIINESGEFKAALKELPLETDTFDGFATGHIGDGTGMPLSSHYTVKNGLIVEF